MITKKEIDQFYIDVDKLGLKFPVAAIAEATEESKGNVSKYLSKKKEPSEKFIARFYERFPKSSKIVSRGNENGDGAEIADTPRSAVILERILENFSESHKNFSIAYKELSESTNKMADNERIILSRIPATAGVDQATLLETVAMVLGMKEFLVEFVAEVKKKPVPEIRKDFHNKVTHASKTDGKKDKQAQDI